MAANIDTKVSRALWLTADRKAEKEWRIAGNEHQRSRRKGLQRLTGQRGHTGRWILPRAAQGGFDTRA
ncbi:hypothetical protein [Acetatifactor aquisgranensis]|uniref:hypothetical protein n=1 Tax=Acetatifactor aquisgranensis TaxID=2941233 RepID=UPI00203BFC2E|nr:hypothetical protein [Acetatifactor aquisgranensis]